MTPLVPSHDTAEDLVKLPKARSAPGRKISEQNPSHDEERLVPSNVHVAREAHASDDTPAFAGSASVTSSVVPSRGVISERRSVKFSRKIEERDIGDEFAGQVVSLG